MAQILPMDYRFEFRPYYRQFKQPLKTSHGSWKVREGIIIRLSDRDDRHYWGEIAPIDWLGSETFEQALNFCRQLPTRIAKEAIFAISPELPACQFGFESAWEQAQNINSHVGSKKAQSYSGLLPSGESALQVCQTLWDQNYRTFKWKIGVGRIENELNLLDQLTQILMQKGEFALLRLDANGGLTYLDSCHWLEACDRISETPKTRLQIEFLEQPLPVTEFDALLKLCDRYTTPLALDESVANLQQLQDCYQRGWRDIFVIKPCIAGSPSQLRRFFQNYPIDAVFSSVFETRIGRQAALALAIELSQYNRALGFGIGHWFDDNEETWLDRLWENS